MRVAAASNSGEIKDQFAASKEFALSPQRVRFQSEMEKIADVAEDEAVMTYWE